MKNEHFKSRWSDESYPRKELMLRYMRDRELVRLAKEQNSPKPWTEDEIIQRYRFCNVYRYHDAVTKHYIRWITPVLDDPKLVVFNTMWYRIFNKPGTADAIGTVRKFEPGKMIRAIEARMRKGHKIFNPAYMITNAMSTKPKYLLAVETFEDVWKDIDNLGNDVVSNGSIEYTTKRLCQYYMFGPFVSYEVATDLTYNILSEAPDRMTWANLGPGAKRGLNRIHRRPLAYPVSERKALLEMGDLMKWLNTEGTFKVEMRDVEHTLCEFDKWCRGHSGEGRPKQKYPGLA